MTDIITSQEQALTHRWEEIEAELPAAIEKAKLAAAEVSRLRIEREQVRRLRAAPERIAHPRRREA
jgi:hypothetical protein